ncbi:MAG: hypothetical protein OER95_19270 [Acidimicrobiia bacterium]|nr:hypothetical protein [Acidimicrobiia bacterium]
MPPRLLGAAVVAGGVVGPEEPALVRHDFVVGTVTNINDVLEGHVRLEVECVDRMLLKLSMRQVEVSRTLVLDDPRRARRFFEALVTDNIGIGRPEEVAVVFARQVRRNTPGQFRTRVFGPGPR